MYQEFLHALKETKSTYTTPYKTSPGSKFSLRLTRWMCIFLTACFFQLSVKAQFTDSLVLTTDNTVSSLYGPQAANVIAGSMVIGANFTASAAYNTSGIKCQQSLGNWPQVPTDGDNLDFPISPVSGYDINLTGLTMTVKVSSSSGNNLLQLAYQADGTGPWTLFGGVQTANSGGTSNINFGALSQTLLSGHTYLIRLYIYAAGATTNTGRQVFVKWVSFTGNTVVSGPPPSVTTDAASATSSNTGAASGTITPVASAVTESGICWSTSLNPTLANSKTSTSPLVSSGSFNLNMTGLLASTTYHVRAYAINGVDTSYGQDLTFTTNSAVLATLTTTPATAIGAISANSGGNISNDGGAPVTQRGVCWNTSSAPTIANNPTSDGTGIGSYSSFLSVLSPSTTYYARAYATNSAGTAYGNEITFTTADPTPTLVVNPDSLGFGSVLQGTTSPALSYTITGYFLSPATGNITITAPPGYRISLSSGGAFVNSLTLPYTSGSLALTTIYVNFSPNSLSNYNNHITNTGGGAPAQNVIVTGMIDPQGGQGQQGFSNKGTDFWTGFGPHEKITGADGTNNNAIMTLYFTSDVADTVTIYVGTDLVQTMYLTGGTITASNVIPWSGVDDARLITEGIYVNKGIYIHSTSPVVAYAEISGSQVTAATVLFPVNTLGRTYTALNYTQLSNSSSSNSRSYAFVVATQDSTDVQVTLPVGITSEGGMTGVNVRRLNRGDVWLVKGSDNVTDITGTEIKSISSNGNACQPIAVFSGSGKIAITCDGSTASSDNLFQQAFPAVAWGRKYVSAPTGGTNYSDNIYRVMINPDIPGTVVTVNGVTLPNAAPIPGLTTASTLAPSTSITLTNGLYYEFRTAIPVVITATDPIMVAQYITNKSKCGNNYNPSAGDPDMVYLSATEQTIDKIIVSPIATQNSNSINYLNVVIKTADIPNFTITDQNTLPVPATFTAIDGTYSYAQILLATGYSPSVFYKLSSTGGGFNAISYGYSSSESYAYNAGTNLVDLASGFSIQNLYGSGAAVAACRGSQFYMSTTLAFRATNIVWDFGLNTNLHDSSSVTQVNPVPVDSVLINGVEYYTYKLPNPYVYSAIGSFPVHISATSPTPDGCNGIKEFTFPVTVNQGPLPDFNFANPSGCSGTVAFTDASVGNGGTINTWNWNFGDNPAGTSIQTSPSYTYTSGGVYNVHLHVLTAEGCYGDTTKVLTFSGVPLTKFGAVSSVCLHTPITFTDSTTLSTGTITQWQWDFGDATPVVNAATNAAQTHTYASAGTYTATLTVTTSTGCTASYTKLITINDIPAVSLNDLSGICTNSPAFALSGGAPATVAGVGTGVFTGTGVTAGGNFDPAVSGAGTFNITYTYTTAAGCVSSAVKPITVTTAVNLTINPVAPLCTSAIVPLTANVTGGTFSGTGVTGNNFDPTVSGVGSFTITYAIASNACATPGTTTIVVNPPATAALSNFSGVCTNAAPITLTGGTPATVAGVGTGVYSGPGVSGGVFSPSVAGAGTATITYTYTTQAGCVKSATNTIVVSQAAVLSINQVGPLCNNDAAVTLVPSLAGGVFTGTGVNDNNQFDPSITGAGTFTINYSIPSNACSVPATATIVVNPAPTDVNAGPVLSTVLGNAVLLTGTTSATGYAWTPVTGLSNPTSLSTQANPSQTTVYTLTATNSFGCKASDTTTIIVEVPCLDPAKIFTPNNDGFYDKWNVFNGACVSNVTVDVYNRWGSLVYHADNYQNNWDGTYNGKPLPDATYYYVVRATYTGTVNIITLKGNVTIMR